MISAFTCHEKKIMCLDGQQAFINFNHVAEILFRNEAKSESYERFSKQT